VQDFHVEYRTTKPRQDVLRECLEVWTGQLGAHGYQLTSQTDVGLSYHRKYRPPWLIIPIVLLFPIGLLFLLVRYDATITATIAPEADGSLLVASGKGPKKVREAFENMEV
jgi:hypothetical protein